jgi:hypothetical protein
MGGGAFARDGREDRTEKKQIPFGDDNQKGKS